MTLKIKTHTGRYRDATRNEVMEAAAAYVRGDVKGEQISSPVKSANYLANALSGFESERFCALWLDNRHRVIEFEVLFVGTVDGTSVYPREVVKRALEVNSAAVIFAHNHPSGYAEPSQADERITKRLTQALNVIDVRVLDHIIVGHDKTTSLASRGMV